jgi:hypothetical protein
LIDFKLQKIMGTQDQMVVNALKIQPTGQLLAAGGNLLTLYTGRSPQLTVTRADDFGNLLIFDLSAEMSVKPVQSRQILPEHGGISEICWISDHVIAVGTTRGKIIVYGNLNPAVSFSTSSFRVHEMATSIVIGTLPPDLSS